MASESTQADTLTPLKGIAVLGGVIVAVAALVAIGIALHLNALYAGFLFVLYWTGLCHAKVDDFAPALIGSLGGIAMAYGLHALPAALGEVAGMVLALGLVLLAVYALIMRWATILVNNAFMLFLTVGSIPMLMDTATLGDMALAVVVSAAYVGVLVLIGKTLASRAAAKA